MEIIMKGINEVKYLLGLKSVRDALWNFGAYFIVIVIGIITSSLLTKNLSPSDYGIVGLIVTIISIISSFIGFGYFEGYGLVLLKEKDKEKQKEIIGSGILLLLVLIFIFFLVTIISLPLISYIYKDISITKSLFIVNFVSCFILGNLFIIYTTKYTGRMKWQAIFSLLQPFFYIILLFLLLNNDSLNYQNVVISIYFAFLLSSLFMIYFLKPRFKNIKNHFNKIKKKQKKEGWHVYVGQSFERSTFHLDNIILGFFDYSSIAFYTLGNMLVQPISVFSSKITDSIVKDLSKEKKIPPKLFIYNFIWWLISSSILLLTAKSIILLFWTEDYLAILDFLYLFLLIALSINIYLILFLFLFVNGKNKELKKYFILRGLGNITGNILLIPLFGIKGAIIATLLGNTLFSIGCYYEYKLFLAKNNNG